MGTGKSPLLTVALFALFVAPAGCRTPHEGWDPPVGEAQAAIRGAPEEAPQILKELAAKLNLMTLKDELELPGDWPPEAPLTHRP